MTLRVLRPRDASALSLLESAINPFPWTRQQFDESFNSGHFGWILEDNDRLQAFALFSQILDEATLLNIAVHPNMRRQGLARKLLIFALQEIKAREGRRCFLEVRVGNAAAIALYRSLGFNIDGKRLGYYPASEGREDALLMSRDLPEQTLENV